MKCPNCSAEFEGADVCPSCGAKMAQEAPKQPDLADRILAKAKSLCTVKNAIIAGVVVVALIIFGAIFNSIFAGSAFDAVKGVVMPVSDGETYHFLYNKKELKDTVAGISDYEFNANGSVMVLIDGEGTLCTVSSSGVKKSSVTDASSLVKVSYDGTGVLYKNGEGELHLYNVKKKKDVTVSQESVTAAVLSPDGDVVAFSRNEDGELKLYYFGGKSETYLGKNVSPVSVDNSGKYIFAYGESTLYRFNRKADKSKVSDASSSSFYLNNSCTQIMFFNESKTYLAVKNKDAVKLNGSSTSSVILPSGSVTAFEAGSGSAAGDIYGCDNLLDAMYRADGNVYTYNKKGDKTKIASDTSYITWTENGKYLFYTDGDTLYRQKVGSSSDPKELTDEISGYYYVSASGKYVYFMDNTGTLYGIKNTGKAKKIRDDAESPSMSAGDVLFFMVDDELYACSNGRSAKRVAKDVGGFTNLPASTVYVNGDHDEYYVSNGSKSFKRVFKKIAF